VGVSDIVAAEGGRELEAGRGEARERLKGNSSCRGFPFDPCLATTRDDRDTYMDTLYDAVGCTALSSHAPPGSATSDLALSRA
jgi:hypothetical protein